MVRTGIHSSMTTEFNPRHFLLKQTGIVYEPQCLLCEEHFVNSNAASKHIQGYWHNHRANQISKEKIVIRSMLDKQQRVQSFFEPRISRLSCPDWQNRVRMDVYMFLNEEGPADEQEITAVHTLERFEHLERVSLLEQAVWRSVCQLHPANTTSDPIYNFQWFQQGWKDRKEEMRHFSSIEIVVKSVLPFLGKDSKKGKNRRSTPRR